MNKIPFLLSTVIFICCSSLPKFAAFTPDWTTQDLGYFKATDSLIVKVPYTNRSETPLVIDSITTSCECNILKYNKKEIKRGEYDTIYVKFDGSIKGSFVKKVNVYSNSKNKMTQLYIRGKSID